MAEEKNPVGEALKKLPGNIVGGPVDFLNLAAGALSGKGLSGLVDKPFGGSEYINKLLGQNEGSSGTGEDLASLALSLANPTAATKSAVIASAALATKLSQGKKVTAGAEAALKLPDYVSKTDALTKTTTEAAMIPALLAGSSDSKFGQKVAESGQSAKEVLKEARKKKAEGASVEEIYKEFGVVQSPGTKKWDAVILNPELGTKTEGGKLKIDPGPDAWQTEKNPPMPKARNSADLTGDPATVEDYLTGLDQTVTKQLGDVKVSPGWSLLHGDASYDAGDKTIRFESADLNKLPALLSHEIQHALDNKFKRPSGGDPRSFESDELSAAGELARQLDKVLPRYNVAKARRTLDRPYSDEMMEINKANKEKISAVKEALRDYSYDQYRRTAGEVKAFAVQGLTKTGDEEQFLKDIQKSISLTTMKYSDQKKMGLDQKFKTDLADELKFLQGLEKFIPPKTK